MLHLASRRAAFFLLATSALALASCTAILGDYAVGEAEGSDAGDEGGAADATVDSGGLDGRVDAPSKGDAADAGSLDAACAPSTPCSAGECKVGTTSCDGGAATCAPTGAALNGTSCDAGTDGAAVCSAGACTSCAVGADCTLAGSCLKKTVVCATGAPVCTSAGNVADGTPCGTNQYCNNGACQACTAGAACTPAGKPCNKGSVTCTGGQATCNDLGVAAADGAACGTNQVCSGGACVACVAGTACNPGGNLCLAGQNSCSTGAQVCTGTGNAPDGTACGAANMACKAGVCGCASGFAMCGGACVNLQKDAASCGRCGHGCLNGACAAGRCQPWVLTSGSSTAPVGADGSYVLLSDGTSVQQIKTAGGAVLTAKPDSFHVRPALANGVIAWPGSNGTGFRVYTVAEGQTAGVDRGGLPAGYAWMTSALNPSATTAFFVAQKSATPYSTDLINCPLASGGCGTLATLATPAMAGYQITQLIVGTSAAFWIYTDGPTQVFSVNRLDFANNAVATVNSKYADKLASDGSFIYFTGTPAGTVYRLPVGFASGAVPQTVTNAPTSITSIASDGTYVYFGIYNASAAANVFYAPVAGGNAQVLFTSPTTTSSSEGSIVAAAGAVYWSDSDVTNDVSRVLGIAAP